MPGKLRYDAKRDKAEPAIVKALEAAGYEVERDLRTDLAVRRSYWEPGVFFMLECKTPRNKRGKSYIDKRQTKQIEFLKRTGVKRVTTPAAALEAVRAISHDADAK